MPREYHNQKIKIVDAEGTEAEVYRYMATCARCSHFRAPAKGYRGRCEKHNRRTAYTKLACQDFKVDEMNGITLGLDTATRDGEFTKMTVEGKTYYLTGDELQEIYDVLGVAR